MIYIALRAKAKVSPANNNQTDKSIAAVSGRVIVYCPAGATSAIDDRRNKTAVTIFTDYFNLRLVTGQVETKGRTR